MAKKVRKKQIGWNKTRLINFCKPGKLLHSTLYQTNEQDNSQKNKQAG